MKNGVLPLLPQKKLKPTGQEVKGAGPLSSSGQPQLLLSSVLLSGPEPQWLNRPLTPFNESSGVLSANTPRPACIVSTESGFTGSQRCSSLDSRAS